MSIFHRTIAEAIKKYKSGDIKGASNIINTHLVDLEAMQSDVAEISKALSDYIESFE